jgi:trehalose synthase
MYHQIVREAANDPDIHVLTNFIGIGNLEVNAFQSHSNLVLQKSIREG